MGAGTLPDWCWHHRVPEEGWHAEAGYAVGKPGYCHFLSEEASLECCAQELHADRKLTGGPLVSVRAPKGSLVRSQPTKQKCGLQNPVSQSRLQKVGLELKSNSM